MRVIAGTYRSRTLATPRGRATRPTSGRLRQALFDVLSPKIQGARFADLYAGSGAIGIEALSRGAASVLFVENAPAALAALRANLAALNLRDGYRIETLSVAAVLRRISLPEATPASSGTPNYREVGSREVGSQDARSAKKSWDLVFLDPPYQSAGEYSSCLSLLGEMGAALLAPGAMVIAEHQSKSAPVADEYGRLRRTRLLKQGDASLSFFEAASRE